MFRVVTDPHDASIVGKEVWMRHPFTKPTLPVEFGASRRALAMLSDTGVMPKGEQEGARRVLFAAALTYVAAAVASILTLLYYISVIRRNR